MAEEEAVSTPQSEPAPPAEEPTAEVAQQPPSKTPAERLAQLPVGAKVGIAAGVLLLVFLIQSWAAGVRASNARLDAFKTSMNALSVACTQTLLDRNAAKTEQLCKDIAQAGGFALVSIASKDRTVLGSSKAGQTGQKIDDPGRPSPTAPSVTQVGNLTRFVSLIVLGQRMGSSGGANEIGYLVVEIPPGD